MLKFKVGDMVVRKESERNNFWRKHVSDPSKAYEVTHITSDDNISLDGVINYWAGENFELARCQSKIDPIQKAKETLLAAGFTVTEPKPKAEGWININRSAAGMMIGSINKSRNAADNVANEFNRIACIHFVEGQFDE